MSNFIRFCIDDDLFTFFSLISMSPETVVEFFFVTIETGVGTRQAVPLVRAVAQILGCKTKKRRSISCSVAHPLVKRKKKSWRSFRSVRFWGYFRKSERLGGEGRGRDSPTFHVGFVVEVGHFPSVLFLVVVVSVSRVVWRSDRLGIGRRCPVEEVGLASGRIGHDTGSGRCFDPDVDTATPWRSRTDHPDEKDQQDQEGDASCNSTGINQC